MVKDTTVRGVLLAAARLIERKGWCQGAGTDARGRHCLMGALNEVGTIRGIDRARTALMRQFPGSFVTTWNDEPWRTKKQVLTALRTAARAPRPR